MPQKSKAMNKIDISALIIRRKEQHCLAEPAEHVPTLIVSYQQKGDYNDPKRTNPPAVEQNIQNDEELMPTCPHAIPEREIIKHNAHPRLYLACRPQRDHAHDCGMELSRSGLDRLPVTPRRMTALSDSDQICAPHRNTLSADG
jgi:hypothetical protein